ncbi:hypothetical protein BDV25DRAFT_142521 [Aspergillus avenaceus]|uniref:Uncharacterized protein n=1 Tax=Aspergillus avenaceus TaxID=36643 RepID=A0A5N6TMT9_ASPAV|nr:hypothetical protein BDV25DRAFT_142521 [Aspergillus avenaceus]
MQGSGAPWQNMRIFGQIAATRLRVGKVSSPDGTFERFSVTSQSSTFRYGKATEQAREQIGAVTLYVGDGETVSSFFEDVQTRIRKLHKFSLGSRPAQPQIDDIKVTRLVHDILQPAALDVIHEREGRDRSMNATQTYSIFIIYIKRSRTRRISLEPTSIAS